MLAEDPINADYRRALVVTYQHAGDYRVRNDKRGALEYFRKAAAADEELLAADPANALTRKDLAYTHKKIADLLVNLEEDNSQISDALQQSAAGLQKGSSRRACRSNLAVSGRHLQRWRRPDAGAAGRS